MIKKQKGESMKNKKIGVGFHSVANDVYESYDKGEEPKEKDLKELYELSIEFVKDYEEREETNNINSKLLELQQKLRNVELAIDLYEKDLYKIDKRLEKIENEGEECIQEKE
jgi:hypothetical protein